MERNRLDEFLANYREIRTSRDRLNETDTRTMIINPFLTSLGWNFTPKQIESEYPVKIGAGTQHVDYCLKIDDSPVAFLEAKPLGSAIQQDDLKQALSYGRIKFVRWCLISNGEDFIILDSDVRDDGGEEVLRFRLGEIEDHQHYLRALSPQGFKGELLNALAEEIRKRQKRLKQFSEKRDDLKNQIKGIVSEFAVDQDALIESIDRFLSSVRSNLEGAAKVSGESPQNTEINEPVNQYLYTKEVSKEANYVRKTRGELEGQDGDLVAIFPSNPKGEEFIRKFNAWGFVGIRGQPKFCAIYFSEPERKIRIIARVQKVLKAATWYESHKERYEKMTDRERSYYAPERFVVIFEGRPIELSDPIPWKRGDPIVQGLRYTTLESLRKAEKVGDLKTPE